MSTVEAIFEDLGGPAKVARLLGISVEHAAGMRRRKSIPVAHWSRLIGAPTGNGDAVTSEVLIQAHAKKVAA